MLTISNLLSPLRCARQLSLYQLDNKYENNTTIQHTALKSFLSRLLSDPCSDGAPCLLVSRCEPQPAGGLPQLGAGPLLPLPTARTCCLSVTLEICGQTGPGQFR